MQEFSDSNHYETTYSNPSDLAIYQAPPDDRDEIEPKFTIDEDLAFNLDVEEPRA